MLNHYPTIDRYVQTKKMEKRAKVQKKSDKAKDTFIRTMKGFTNPDNRDIVVPINWSLVKQMDARTRMMVLSKASAQ